MDEITSRCEGIRLSDIERSEVDLSMPMTETGYVLAGKFCTLGEFGIYGESLKIGVANRKEF